MRYIFSILLCVILQTGFSQGIIKTVGISYTNGTPTYTPAKAGSALALDTVTWRYYTWNGSTWLSDGFRVQTISGCSTPAYTPTKYQSLVVINACNDAQGGPEIYKWSGSVWEKSGGTAYTAGTGIAISGGNVISNIGDLSATNELNTSLSISGSNLQIIDAGGTLTVPVSSIAPVQAVAAGAGISIAGTTTRTVTNTAPDQTVAIAAGTGIGISGTYPSFTVTNSSPNVVQTLSIAGQDLTLSGGGGTVTIPSGGINSAQLADSTKNVRAYVRDYETGGRSTILGALGWNSADYNQEYDFIPNKFSYTSAPVLNYSRAGMIVQTSLLAIVNGGALTVNSASDEFGQVLAERFTGASGSGALIAMQVSSGIYPNLPAGTYTVTWKMRTETGTYNVKWGDFVGTETTTSLSTTWQTFSFNFTYDGSSIKYTSICHETGTAVNVRIGEIFLLRQNPLFPPAARITDGHAYTISQSDFKSNSKLLYSPQMAVIMADSILFDTVCVTSIVRPVFATVGVYESIFSNKIDYTKFWFGLRDSTTFFSMTGGSGANSPVLVNNATTAGRQGYVLIIQKIGGTYQCYINGVCVQQAGVGTSFWFKQFYFGYLNSVDGFTFPGFVEDVSIYKGVCDPAALTRKMISSSTLGREVRTDKCIFGEGDSITDAITAVGGGAPKLSGKKTKIVTANLALSGSGVSDLNTRKSTLKAQINIAAKVYKKVIVTVHIGRNNLVSTSGATYYASVMAYVAELRALGAKVVMCTALPSTVGGSFETNRNAYNALLRAGVGVDFDALVDYDTTIMGTLSTASNATYYYDGTHPTLTGQQILEAVYTAAIIGI